MEANKILSSQSHPEKEEKSWSHHTSGFEAILQRYSN